MSPAIPAAIAVAILVLGWNGANFLHGVRAYTNGDGTFASHIRFPIAFQLTLL